MRSTGIISLRGNGRYIDLNSLEQQKIEYIISNYPVHKTFASTDEYMAYMGQIDKTVVSLPRIESDKTDERLKIRTLRKYAQKYSKEEIFEELLNLCCKKKPSSDPVLKFIEGPTRLEFLTSLALVQHFKGLVVSPNYVIDDEGLPTRHASGGKADIVCLDYQYEGLVEVTLMLGRQQVNNEILPIARHLHEELEKRDKVVSVFIAPNISEDAARMARWLKADEKIDIATIGINEFLDILSNYSSFDEMISGELDVA